MSTMTTHEESTLYTAIATGSPKQAEAATREALAAGVSPNTLLVESLIPAMKEVDAQFQCKDCSQPELCYVPEQMLVKLAIDSALNAVRPVLANQSPSNGVRVVIGTVEGDRCDLGRNLVAPLLQGYGFEVVDRGVGATNAELVQAAAEQPGTILVLYTRKTSSAAQMKQIKQDLMNCSPPCDTKLLVVGHKITEELCREIGADDFTDDALQTIDKVSRLAGLC